MALAHEYKPDAIVLDMQLPVMLDGKTFTKLRPTEQWKTAKLTAPADLKVDENYYVVPKAIP